jgi:hypothetical protein
VIDLPHSSFKFFSDKSIKAEGSWHAKPLPWPVLCISARFMLISPSKKIGHLMRICKQMLFYAYQRNSIAFNVYQFDNMAFNAYQGVENN